MLATVLLAVSVLGLGLVFVQWWAQRRLLHASAPVEPEALPPVSILKPLKGADPDLARNLETFFALDYPAYELVFSVQDASDEAVGVVRSVARHRPGVEWSLVADSRAVGINPKVNNLAHASRVARHDVLLVSDSNVSVRPGYLRDMVVRLLQPGVGLVTSPIRGVPSGGDLGSALEALQLNTWVMGSVALVQHVIERPCVVGKSMMLRREHLARIGGWSFLGRFLAEDQACAQEIDGIGLCIVVTSSPVDNVLGPIGLRGFMSRHVRWARLRRFIAPAAYCLEAVANPVFVALLAAVAARDARMLIAPALVLLALSAVARSMERRIGLLRPAWHYPALELVRSVATGLAWPLAWLARDVTWRGNTFRIGPRSELTPASTPVPGTVLEGSRGGS